MRTRAPLLCCALLAACQANPYGVDRENAAQQLAQAEADLADGAHDEAFGRLQAIWAVESLQPELRVEVERLLGEAAPRTEEVDADDLIDLAELDLPSRLRVDLWVAAAERLLEEGERMDAYREVRDLEQEFPLHTRADDAAEVVADAGLSLSRDDGRYLFFFPYRSKGPEVLEYLVLTFPQSDRCAEVYARLAAHYEEDGDWELAIERHQELLEYHIDSEYAVASELRIPYLRLYGVQNAEYDRHEMVLCRAELEAWILRHPEHRLQGWAAELLVDCRRRLVDHDLAVARFYAKIENGFGARRAGDRALIEARGLADAERVAAVEALLAALPEESAMVDPDRVEGPGLDEGHDTGFGADVGPETSGTP